MSCSITTPRRAHTMRNRVAATAVLLWCVLLSACAKHLVGKESIVVLRSIRERVLHNPSGCAASRTGFDPYATDAERHYTFWAVATSARDGRVLDAGSTQVAVLRGCFGPTDDRTRQNFSADIDMGELSFRGRGECVALAIDVPERGMNSVRCHLVLSGLPPNYTGGLLTTNTLTSQESYGGETNPAGYTQASIATIRLWKTR